MVSSHACTRVPALLTALVCACLLLASCETYEPQSTAADAQAYYQQKYGTKATVADTNQLGNYGLFGYHYSGMEYLMSDGASVVYVDDEGVFRDNRQGDEVAAQAEAFAREQILAVPGALTQLDGVEPDGEVGFETYEGQGPCWHAYYDGDIRTFLQEERPRLYLTPHFSGGDYAEGSFSFDMAYDAAQADGLDAAYLDLARYFDISSITLAVVDRTGFEAKGEGDDGITLFDDALVCTIGFEGDSADTVRAVRFKPVFVTIMDGMQASSAKPGVQLNKGDVALVPRGSGFYRCMFSDELRNASPQLECYLRNESGLGITRVHGIDEVTQVCQPGQASARTTLEDGAVFYLGDPADILPWVEVESVDAQKVVMRYHTFFKKSISKVSLKVIGMAYRDGSAAAETSAFDSRIVGETDDGWVVEVAVREDAVPDNEFYLQFTYNDDTEVSVQIAQPVQLSFAANEGLPALRVEGTHLVDATGSTVQLRGISTHGLAWFPQYVNAPLFQELHDEWGANAVRLALYTQEYGGWCEGGDRAALRKLASR